MKLRVVSSNEALSVPMFRKIFIRLILDRKAIIKQVTEANGVDRYFLGKSGMGRFLETYLFFPESRHTLAYILPDIYIKQIDVCNMVITCTHTLR